MAQGRTRSEDRLLEKPKYLDPRTTSVEDFVSRKISEAAPHENQDAVLSILRGPRDTEALRSLAKLLPKRAGLSYDATSLEKRSTQRLKHALLAAAEHGSQGVSVVLDVGCARGENAHPLAEIGVKKYIGLDIDDTYFPDAASFEIDVELIRASAEDMPLPDNSVDLAISFNVFEHVPTPGNALKEIIRALRPGGVFYTKFGPPFNAAAGPHLTRFVDLPFMHHLFPEKVVAEFTKRTDAYYTVNKRPLRYYRAQFFAESGFRLASYREQIHGRGFWLLKNMPELRLSAPLDELAICSITAVAVKNS